MALQEVMFHTGVADVPAHIARVAAKVLRSGETMAVLCAADEVHAIDAALWQLDKTSFVPHARPGSSAAVQACSPIAIVTHLDELGPNMSQRLVSSLQVWVDGCETFDKLIELVTLQGTVDARQRWKRYAQMGLTLSNTAVNR